MIKFASPDASDEELVEEYKEKKYWGMETLINLYDCDRELIKDPKHIERYIIELCEVIDMHRFGNPIIERFGAGNLYGYSAVQLIHTSCITAHFAEESGDVYIDVFSCKHLAPTVAAEFSRKFFKGKREEHQTIFRD